MKSGQSLIPIFHRYYVQELFALFFFYMKMSIPYIKLDSSLFVVVVPLCFIQSSDFKAFRVHFVNKRMLPPFLTIFFWARSTKHIIFSEQGALSTPSFSEQGALSTPFFSEQWALSTPFSTALTTCHVTVAPDIQRLLRTDFILVSISSNTRNLSHRKKSDFFLFLNNLYILFFSR